MTEAESEVELGAGEEKSTTEAAPKGLEFPPSLLQHPERPPTALEALLVVHLDFRLSIRQ